MDNGKSKRDPNRRLSDDELEQMSDDELLDIVADGIAKPAEPGRESAAEYLERQIEAEREGKQGEEPPR